MWTKGKRYIVAAIVIAIAVIIVGLALSPGVQKQTPVTTNPPTNNPSNPSNGTGNGGTGGNGGSGAGSGGSSGSGGNVAAPSWGTGDYWKYNVTVGRVGMMPQSFGEPAFLHGVVTKTVTGKEETPAGNAYNVSVTASFALNESFCTMENESTFYRAATVAGFILYRTSDLARIADAWTLSLNGSTTVDNHTFAYSFVAKTWTAYDPALAIWHFPLSANRTWNATSNVTVRQGSQVMMSWGNHTLEMNRSWNGTFALRLVMASGIAANVTVPAGTFGSIPVSVAAGPQEYMPDRVASEILNVTNTLDDEPSHAFVLLWYSGPVGNVVKATTALGPWDEMALRAELVAYRHSGGA